jgi:hypothetical protein
MSHLYKSLGDYRFSRAVTRTDGDLYCFEYQLVKKPEERVYVAWLAAGEGKAGGGVVALKGIPQSVYRVERTAISSEGGQPVDWKLVDGTVQVEVTETPIFIWAK